MSRRAHLATLWGAILLTWGSVDMTRLVTIERRLDPPRAWKTLAQVPGTFYLDTQPKEGKRYCYRARYSDAATWAPTVCAQSATPVEAQ
jgi:hypothetical protein